MIRFTGTLAQNLLALFWISVFNFIFPVLLTVVLLVLTVATSAHNAIVGVEQITMYANIIGVVFATVWASGNHWAGEHLDREEGSTLRLSSLFTAAGGQRSSPQINSTALLRTRTTSSSENAHCPREVKKPSRVPVPPYELSAAEDCANTKEPGERVTSLPAYLFFPYPQDAQSDDSHA